MTSVWDDGRHSWEPALSEDEHLARAYMMRDINAIELDISRILRKIKSGDGAYGDFLLRIIQMKYQGVEGMKVSDGKIEFFARKLVYNAKLEKVLELSRPIGKPNSIVYDRLANGVYGSVEENAKENDQ